VNELPLRFADDQLLEVDQLRFIEAAAPSLSPREHQTMDRVWEEAAQANPHLFDGPVVACVEVNPARPRGLVLTWARTTYRFYVLRRTPGATLRLPSLSVIIVQPTDDGRLLLGRMSAWTAYPGRWQLPGGAVEPPDRDHALDAAVLRWHAARELVEEIGVDVSPDDLTLWRVFHGVNGNVGVLFLAPPQPESVLREQYAALVASETALGQDPELDQLAFVRSYTELAYLKGPQVRYLKQVARSILH
jgi:8-oxo-dGTP pyrophosphatase MutT (NUDIX family)